MTQIEVSLNCYEYDALKEELLNSGKYLYEEIDKLVKSFYEEIVPLEKKQEAERKMQEDEHYTEELNDPRKFAVVRLHNQDGDYYFIAENQCNLYRIASRLYYGDIKEAEKYTLDSIAQIMCYKESCDKFIFSVLEKAQANDPRISSVLEIDYESRIVTVQEYGKQRAKYRFDDLSDAASIAICDLEQSEYRRNETFHNELNGMEWETESIGMKMGS